MKRNTLLHKKTSIVLHQFLLGLLLAISSVETLAEASETKRVLFLGNSVFYFRGGLYPAFQGFCREANLDYQVVSQRDEPPNSAGIEFLNYGRIPLNLPAVAGDEEIHELIRSGDFDYVILEGRRSGFLLPASAELPDHRGVPIPYRKNFQALSALHRTIVAAGAQTVFYMHPGSKSTTEIKLPLAQLYQRLHEDLKKVVINGRRHDVILVPAMLLWLDGVRQFGVDAWFHGEGHGNALARYSSACMLYTYLTGKDPRRNSFRGLTDLTRSWELIPENAELVASAEDARWIKDQVWLYYAASHR